jgi:hypothetical protein
MLLDKEAQTKQLRQDSCVVPRWVTALIVQPDTQFCLHDLPSLDLHLLTVSDLTRALDIQLQSHLPHSAAQSGMFATKIPLAI